MDLGRLLLSVVVDETCSTLPRQPIVVIPAALEILATPGIRFAQAGREGRVCAGHQRILVLDVHDISEVVKTLRSGCTLPLVLWRELSDEDGSPEQAINAVLDSQHQSVNLGNSTGCLWADSETCG